MSLTGSGTHCIFFSHSQLTFLQCHGRLCYENWPHSVNNGTEFSPVKFFSFFAFCTIMWISASFQHLYSMEGPVSPRYYPWNRKISVLGRTSFSKFSFIYRHGIYKYHMHTQDIYTVWEKVAHFKGQTICRHACVCPNFNKEGLVGDSKYKVGQSSAYGWCQRSGTFHLVR